MHINYDIDKKIVVHADRANWRRDPSGMMDLLYLDLVDSEKSVATMLMRLRKRALLPVETLNGGKELLVLEGDFQDERGNYPVGSYMRFPPGSRQEPYSDNGGLLFAKTWQFSPRDRAHVNIDAYSQYRLAPRKRPGVQIQHLFGDNREDVRIEHWDANHRIVLNQCNGLEVFVLSGGFFEPSTVYKKHSWLRLPPNQPLRAIVGDKGARVFIKEGHLVHEVPGRPRHQVSNVVSKRG